MAKDKRIVDLRDGFRIEVIPMVAPRGEFGARLAERRYTVDGDRARNRWKDAGPLVVAASPEQAAQDLLKAINEGLLPDVEVKG